MLRALSAAAKMSGFERSPRAPAKPWDWQNEHEEGAWNEWHENGTKEAVPGRNKFAIRICQRSCRRLTQASVVRQACSWVSERVKKKKKITSIRTHLIICSLKENNRTLQQLQLFNSPIFVFQWSVYSCGSAWDWVLPTIPPTPAKPIFSWSEFETKNQTTTIEKKGVHTEWGCDLHGNEAAPAETEQVALLNAIVLQIWQHKQLQIASSALFVTADLWEKWEKWFDQSVLATAHNVPWRKRRSSLDSGRLIQRRCDCERSQACRQCSRY